MKIHNFDDYLKVWWCHQKGHVTLVIILGFFGRFYVVPHSCKFSCLVFNWFAVYDTGVVFCNPRLFNVKNPRLVRVKASMKCWCLNYGSRTKLSLMNDCYDCINLTHLRQLFRCRRNQVNNFVQKILRQDDISLMM